MCEDPKHLKEQSCMVNHNWKTELALATFVFTNSLEMSSKDTPTRVLYDKVTSLNSGEKVTKNEIIKSFSAVVTLTAYMETAKISTVSSEGGHSFSVMKQFTTP